MRYLFYFSLVNNGKFYFIGNFYHYIYRLEFRVQFNMNIV